MSDTISSQSLMKVFTDDSCHIDLKRFIEFIKRDLYDFFPVGICNLQRECNVKLGLKIINSLLQSINNLYKNLLCSKSQLLQ